MFPKTKKLLLIFLVSFEILALNSYPVLAFLDLGFPFTSGSSNGGFASPTSMMEEIEKRYNIDKGSMKNFMQGFNVSEQKGVAPAVQLFFEPADPKPGEEITATSIGSNFDNKKENLVYRWYIKHLTPNDINKDGSYDLNDWLTEATMKIANNGFRSERVDYGTSGDADNDGYNIQNVFGGTDRQYKDGGDPSSNQQCYMHDYKSGSNYEVVNEDAEFHNGDGSPVCGEGETPMCVRSIPYIGAQDFFADAAGEGTGGTGTGGTGGDGSGTGGTGGTGTGGGAAAESIVQGFTMETGGQCVDTKEAPFCSEAGAVSCTNGIPICYPGSSPSSRIVCRATRCEIVTNDSAIPWHITTVFGEGTVERCEENCKSENGENILGSGSYPGCPDDPEPYDYDGNFTPPSCNEFSGTDHDSKCDHFFPTYAGDRASACGITNEEVGDGTFTAAEECYWGTNPYDSGTKENQRNDEAVVAGLGQDKFTWIYQPGDKVGVFVEGTSFFPTKYDDSSKMVMFAMPNNSCIEDGRGTSDTKVVPGIRGQNVSIETIKLSSEDLEGCFNDNLIDPTQGGQGKKINVKLSYSPQSPINGQVNSTGDQTRGDLVTLRTSLEDSNRDEALLYYKYTIWAADEVSGGDVGQPGVGAPPPINSYTDRVSLEGAGWSDVTSDLSSSSNNGSSSQAYFEGNGLSSVKFRLNNTPLIAGKKYLLAVVEVFEGNRTNELNAGVSGAMITMNNSGANLQINLASSTDGSGLSNAGNQICMLGSSGMCEVIPGQIIQVQAPENAGGMKNFQWSINGKQINCSGTMNDECSTEDTVNGMNSTRQGATIFFPINGSPGDILTLSLNANEVDSRETDYVSTNNTGLSTNLTQQLMIVEPSVKIVTPDDAGSVWSAVLGEYYPDSEEADACTYDEITSEGTRTTNTCVNTSQSVFGTSSGSSVTLNAQFSPKWLDDLVTSNPDMFEIRWVVDGQEITGTGKSVSFTAGEEGDVHSVEISVMFKQDIGSRRAVNKFGSGSQEHYFSDSVQIEVFGGSAAMTQAGPRKYFASLISNVPGQTLFMLRIALTIFVIILVSNIFSSASIIPRAYAFQNRNKK
jgi:hypothetical protein